MWYVLQAYSGDGLPCMICKKCLATLTAAYKLKLLARESNRQLLLSLSSHSLKDTEQVKTVSRKSLKSKEETKINSSDSLKSKEEAKTNSSDSLKSKEEAEIKEEALQKEYKEIPLIENKIKKEDAKDWMQDEDDYIEDDTKPFGCEDDTRWDEGAPTKEEAGSALSPSTPPPHTQGSVNSTDSKYHFDSFIQ